MNLPCRAVVSFTLMLALPSSVFAAVRADLKFKLIAELDKSEVDEGHLFHAGLLWVGKTHQQPSDPHTISVYSNGGETLVQNLEIPHSVMSITAFDANSVIVVGRTSVPSWRNYYSVIKKTGSSFSIKTTSLPEQYMVSDFAGRSDKLFFSEVGDAMILESSPLERSVRPLPIEISGPGKLALDGNSLFVIENRNMDFGDEDIIKINLNDNSHTRTFNDHFRNGLVNIQVLKGVNYLAAAEAGADQVLLIDRTSNLLAHTLVVEGRPRALSQIGHCLVVATEEKQGVVFFDLNGSEPKMIDRWDLSAADPRFNKGRSVAVDEATGQIFLRSTYPCGSCSQTQSSVVRVEQLPSDGDGVFKKCLAN
jgi:hypothetical protein